MEKLSGPGVPEEQRECLTLGSFLNHIGMRASSSNCYPPGSQPRPYQREGAFRGTILDTANHRAHCLNRFNGRGSSGKGAGSMRVGVKQHVPSPYGVWIPWRSTAIGKLAFVHSRVSPSLQRQEGLVRHATCATSYNELSGNDYMHTHARYKPNAHEAEGCDPGEG